MTEKIFWQDQYLKEFEGKVIEIRGKEVILDKTVFYARSGGQPGDTGEINGIKVIDTYYDDKGNIVHLLEKEPNFNVGDIVKGKIDWERRYKLMRLHTALHILSAVLNNLFGNIKITGSQIYEDKARIDFDLDKLDDESVKKIEEKANEIVNKDLPVYAKFINKEELEKMPQLKRLMDEKRYEKYDVLRVVGIGDIDIQLDGGTHVKFTKEIGRIKIIGKENKGKNNKRLIITIE
ncbi:MAG: alanyl-tRNA editing protein [Candidatus Nanopusillus sp.]